MDNTLLKILVISILSIGADRVWAQANYCQTHYCLPTDANGWAMLSSLRTPSTRTVYVSSSSGNDLNDGLSEATAKRTIANAKHFIRDGYPDWLVLKPGDVFANETLGYWCASGPSPQNPVVIASYEAVTGNYSPTAAQPLIRFASGIAWEAGINCPSGRPYIQNVVLSGIHFEGSPRWGGMVGLVMGSSDLNQIGHHHLFFEDLTINNVSTGIGLQAVTGSSSSTGLGRLQYITIRRSRIFDVGYPWQSGTIQTSLGVFIDGVDHLYLSENLVDQNGWEFDSATGRALYNNANSHHFYVTPGHSTDVINDGMIVSRGSATGFRACVGICTNNLLLQNPTALDMGFDTTVVKDNVILDGRDIENPGYIGTPVQGRAVGISGRPAPGAQITGNIVAHNERGTGAITAFSFQADSNTEFSNNIVYKWNYPRPPTENFGHTPALQLYATPGTSGVRIHHNNFYQSNYGGGAHLQFQMSSFPSGSIQFYSNNYFTNSPIPFLEWDSGWLNPSSWQNRLEQTSTFEEPSFANPERTSISTYLVDRLGTNPSADPVNDFMLLARQQRRGNWNPHYMATAVNAYVREGFQTCTGSGCQPNQFNILASTGSGGMILPSGNISVSPGANQLFRILPINENYRTTDVRVDNVSIGAVSVYNFEAVNASHSITANFEVLSPCERADLNGDGIWNIQDRDIFQSLFGQDVRTDFDLNGSYSVIDFNTFLNTLPLCRPSTYVAPTAPINLSVKAINPSEVSIQFTSSSSNQTGFSVERSRSGDSGFSEIGRLTSTVTTYVDSGISVRTTYYYRVRAFNSAGYSPYSNTANVRTRNRLGSP